MDSAGSLVSQLALQRKLWYLDLLFIVFYSVARICQKVYVKVSGKGLCMVLKT